MQIYIEEMSVIISNLNNMFKVFYVVAVNTEYVLIFACYERNKVRKTQCRIYQCCCKNNLKNIVHVQFFCVPLNFRANKYVNLE